VEINISSTIVFEKNWNAFNDPNIRFIINEGGTRSSKTVSICQMLIIYALTNPKKIISIVRKTFPALRATVMRDFFEQIENFNLLDSIKHNKSEHFVEFQNGTIVEFFSVDDEQKVRGRKRDIVWGNEANELFGDDFFQLNLRTNEKLIFDYNPTESSSWLYELPIDESILIKSTYKDNPFLQKSIIKQIEDLKYTDEARYQIFALGQKTTSKLNIYSHFVFTDVKPPRFQQYVYGLDFGYNHPTALIRVWWFENEVFLEEVIYESYLTTSDLVDKFIVNNIEKNIEFFADWARPEIIAELQDNGYNIQNADKAVKKGIDDVKSFKVFTNSKNVWKEFENYKWKKIGEKITDEPVKLWDDAMDASRYAIRNIKLNGSRNFMAF
jgi:phage terminase large subunit